MEDVGNLEVDSVIEHEVPANDSVDIVRGRRRKHHFQLVRARLRMHADFGRQRLAYDQTAFEPGRQTVSLRQSRWQMAIVSAIPVMDVAVMVAVLFMSISMSVAVTFMVFLVPTVVVVIAIVLIVAAPVIACHRDRR